MMSKRIKCFDVAKGLLITCLMFHHTANIMGEIDVPGSLISLVSCWNIFFLVFFMQAFFLITGYCSNFDKPLRVFVKDNIRTLFIPALFFSLLNILVNNYRTYITVDPISFVRITLGSLPLWFFWALLMGKILYWVIRKTKYSVLVMLLFAILGGACFLLHIKNVFFFENSLLCSFFLSLGEYLKRKQLFQSNKTLGALAFGSFFILMTFLLIFKLPTPVVTAGINFSSYIDIALYFVLSTLGSLTILYISMLLENMKILESIGQNTLVIYGIQAIIIRLLVNFYGVTDISKDNFTVVLIMYILIAVFSLAICYGVSLLFRRYRYLQPLAGIKNGRT